MHKCFYSKNINNVETADRSKVFHIYGFPSSTKQVDIVSAFKQYGQVYIRWKDDTSCFLGIKSKIMAEVVKKDFKLVVTTSDDDDEEDGKDAEEENENEKPGKQQQQHQEGEEEVGGARTWRGSFGTFKIETFDQYQGGNDDEESEQEETVTIMEEGEIPKGNQ